MKWIEDILVGLIGRPVLTLVKWGRWMFLIGGLYFGEIATIDPETMAETAYPTRIPLLVGFILFCIGLTVKRYDELLKNEGIIWSDKDEVYKANLRKDD